MGRNSLQILDLRNCFGNPREPIDLIFYTGERKCFLRVPLCKNHANRFSGVTKTINLRLSYVQLLTALLPLTCVN